MTMPSVNRRKFLSMLAGAPALASLAAPALARRPARDLNILTVAVAGFIYPHGPELWPQLQAGDALRLVREPDNSHDPRAIRVDWKGYKLGYVPRALNSGPAAMMDRGEMLHGSIAELEYDEDTEWMTVMFEVWVRV